MNEGSYETLDGFCLQAGPCGGISTDRSVARSLDPNPKFLGLNPSSALTSYITLFLSHKEVIYKTGVKTVSTSKCCCKTELISVRQNSAGTYTVKSP